MSLSQVLSSVALSSSAAQMSKKLNYLLLKRGAGIGANNGGVSGNCITGPPGGTTLDLNLNRHFIPENENNTGAKNA